MGIRGLTSNWAFLLTTLAGLSACAEEEASIHLDAMVSAASSSDAGASKDAGGSTPSAMTGEKANVEVATGKLTGTSDGMMRRFLGIPYAKPPVGELRWQRPQPPARWTSPRDASKFGGRCAQADSAVLMNPASDNEDCLYLNVWAPVTTAKEALPVMVWIHGGGNMNGSASELVPYSKEENGLYFYEARKLAEKGVVVVTFNYRLGVFGFFSHPGLDESDARAGNQGMWDQVAALEWVQTNIAKFGGDPKNVTIFGESAGSYDVCILVASGKGRGLFHKAISQSGGCTTLTTTREQAEQTAAGIAEAAGCAGDDELACLRDKSVAELLEAAKALPAGGATRTLGPSVEGDFLADQPRTLFTNGTINKVPYLLGSNTDEGTLFTAASAPIASEEQYKAALAMQFPASADQVEAVYPLDNFADAKPNPAQAALTRIAGDSRLVCSTTDTAILASAHVPVYTYNFDIPIPEGLSPVFLGATHGAELVYVFQTSPSFDAEQTAVSNLIQRYWTNFAKTGNPNGGKDPKWPKFSEEDDQRMNFALAEQAAVEDFRKSECALWREGYELMFNAPPAPTP